jgi:hypothetical protein
MQDEPTTEDKLNLKKSAKIMNAFVKEGELKTIAKYSGFLHIFPA